MIPNDVVRNVEWTLVSVQQPAKAPSPAGVVVLDPDSDELHIRLLPELTGTDRDMGEFWRDLPGYLSQRSREVGGAQLLEWLETVASHVVQLSARSSIATDNPREALDTLYRLHVAIDPPHSEG